MFRNTSIKKTLICVVALLMLATVAFAACNGSSFKPTVDLPTGSVVVSTNGGIAVQYGDYIYYVNGLASATTANTYENVDARVSRLTNLTNCSKYITVRLLLRRPTEPRKLPVL